MAQPPYSQLHIYEVDGDLRPQVKPGLADYLGLWLEGNYSYLFFASPAAEVVSRMCGRAGLQLLSENQLSYERWQGGLCMAPLDLGRLLVAPAWGECLARPGQMLLRLDPGLVFGNGLHPTTRHCLELLLLVADLAPLGRVLDLGCGSGILALAAAALGAEAVLAVDLNPLCVDTSQRNVELNQAEVEVAEGPAGDFLGRPAEVLMANIHWAVMHGLLSDPAPLAGKRHLILSGLLRSQAPLVEERLLGLGYRVMERREADFTWFSLWAQKA